MQLLRFSALFSPVSCTEPCAAELIILQSAKQDGRLGKHEVRNAKTLQTRKMKEQNNEADADTNQTAEGRRHRKRKPPESDRGCKIPIWQHEATDSGNADHDQRHWRDQACLYRRGANDDPSDDRHRLADALGQMDTGLLQ